MIYIPNLWRPCCFFCFSFHLTCFDSDDCQVILDSDYTKNKKPTPFCGDGQNSALVIFCRRLHNCHLCHFCQDKHAIEVLIMVEEGGVGILIFQFKLISKNQPFLLMTLF